MKQNSYNQFFSNFSNKIRLKIISCIDKYPANVNTISNKINEEQSKVSHHLRKLRECGIVSVEIKGKERIYSLNKKTVVPILEIVKSHMKNNCCKNCKKECNCF